MRLSFIVIPTIALVLGGCSVAQKVTDTVKQTAEQKAIEQEVRANCKYDKDVCDYFVAQAKMWQQSFTMKMSYAGKEKTMQGYETVTKMDGKENLHSISTKNGKEESNMIVFNNITYFKDYQDNKWMKMTSTNDSEESLFDVKSTIDDMKDTFKEENSELTVTKVGQEACPAPTANLTCVIYDMVDGKDKEFGTTKTWIDTKDHYARKMEIASPDGSKSTILYTYEPVTITEPSPVKEFAAPKMPALKPGEMPSQADIDKLLQDLPAAPDMPTDTGSEE